MSIAEPITTCQRHPKTETNLRCAACGAPICPECLVQTPVGSKCRDCASQKGLSLFTLSPLQAVSAIATGLAFGAVLGWGVEFSIGYFTFFLAFVYGGFAGRMIMRASGRKRGKKLEITAGATMAAGALGGRVVVAALAAHLPGGISQVMVGLVLPTPIPLIALAIATASAVSAIRYI